MKELAYLNGVFMPIDEARISIEDRGYQFGDGVYEVIAAYEGRPFLLDEHLTRLKRSLRATAIDFSLEEYSLESVIRQGLRESEPARRAMVYIQITRGTESRSHIYGAGLAPTVVLTFKPMPQIAPELRTRGASLVSVEDIRWAHCYIKAITLLPNVLVKTDAVRRGFDDAVFVASTGEVRECTSANIFIVRDGAVLTPPRTQNVLHGITQGFLMDCAEGIGLPMEESEFDLSQLRAAEEVFMSSTTLEVWGVTRIDGAAIADGTVGESTQRLHREYQIRAQERNQGPATLAG